ncbi:haloacid dehalogenase [Bosea sp. MMO-172]|uniref:haloacid dehalogenase n=1 Tax=Bosea sp. MMO-172 TaxID=3127885 RepID=UPI00301B218D
MTVRIHSLWLMPAPSDEALLTGFVSDLSGRFGTPFFAPHLTLQGDTETTPAALERAITAAAGAVEAFTEPVSVVEGSDAYFRSFYARFAVSPALAKLKQVLDPEGLASFMPHVSLLYGQVEATAKAAAIAEIDARLAGRPIRFDRIGIVTSGQDVPIADWRVVTSVALRSA